MTNFERIKRLLPGELQVLKRMYGVKTHKIEKENALNEGMRWIVLDAADHPRLWYAFFDTEESAIKAYLASTGASLEI